MLTTPPRHRVIFYCPEPKQAVGGVSVIYQFAATLRDHGVEAFVLHPTKGYVYPGAEVSPSIQYSDDAAFTTSDIFVIPEIFGPSWAELVSPAKFVVLNQNAFLTFNQWELDETRSEGFTHVYEHPNLLAVVCVSSSNRRYVRTICDLAPMHQLTYGVEAISSVHKFRDRELSIAYMPRKRSGDSSQVLQLLALWGELNDVQVHRIDGMGPAAVRETLAHTAIFLSFAEMEGFSLPVLEAMAAGCLVIGYDGSGGADALSNRTGYPIPYGDTLAFAQATRKALTAIRKGRFRSIERRVERASKLMRSERTIERQEESMLAIWSEIEKSAVAEFSGNEEQPLSIDFTKLKTYARAKRAANGLQV